MNRYDTPAVVPATGPNNLDIHADAILAAQPARTLRRVPEVFTYRDGSRGIGPALPDDPADMWGDYQFTDVEDFAAWVAGYGIVGESTLWCPHEHQRRRGLPRCRTPAQAGLMNLITRPLTEDLRMRLRKVTQSYSPFKASWKSTLTLLDREVWYVAKRGADPILMIDIEERHLRLDGGLRADAKPASSVCALSVETPTGPLIFPCGKFTTWQDNVRAIALGMEALRKVDRYGITVAAEQYRGFRAIGDGTPMPAVQMTIEEAARLVANLSAGPADHVRTDVDHVRRNLTGLFREALKRVHPHAGGDAELFKRLVAARDLVAS